MTARPGAGGTAIVGGMSVRPGGGERLQAQARFGGAGNLAIWSHFRGLMSGSSTNSGTGYSVTGSIEVTAGDLVVINYSLSVTPLVSFSDNLGNAYHRLHFGVVGGRPVAAWAYVKTSGTLTSVTASHSSTSSHSAFVSTVIGGPFSPWALDVDTLPLSDNTSPYVCPNSGTLSQADEFIVGFYGQSDGAATAAATSPYVLGGAASSGTSASTVSGALSVHSVSSTSAEAPEFTSGVNSTGGTKTASFRKAFTTVFGDCIGVFDGIDGTPSTSPTTLNGFASVSIDDLVVVTFAQLTSVTATTVTDNLGNTYTAQNAGSALGAAGRTYYSIITVAGDLTSITVNYTGTSENTGVAAAFKGPITAIDASPANATNAAAATINCPDSGTLAQADELVIGWTAFSDSRFATAVAPSVLTHKQTSANEGAASTVGAAISSRVVSSTSSVTDIDFTISAAESWVAGALTFKKATVAAHVGEATFAGTGTLSAQAYIDARIIVSWAELETTGVLSSATFGGVGTFSALARIRFAGAADFDGVGNLSVNFRQGNRAAATFAGAGSLSVNTTQRQSATARFAGAGNLSADAIFPPKLAAATFSGSGNLSALATLQVRAIVSWAELETTGVLSAATFAGTGNLSVNAVIAVGGVVQQAQATFEGQGNLSALASLGQSAAARFGGVGNLSVNTAATARQIAATFSGAGNLSVRATLGQVTAASFGGIGNLFVNTAATSRQLAATFAGIGNLSVAAGQNQAAAAFFIGNGGLSIATQFNLSAAATFAGVGNLSARAVIGQAAAAFFNGSGNLSAYANLNARIAATFNGVGNLSAAYQVAANQISATFAGAGNLSVRATQGNVAAATFGGVGNLSVVAQGVGPLVIRFAGVGNLSAAITQQLAASAFFAGSGNLSAAARQQQQAAAFFAGTGSLSVTARLGQMIAARFAGAGNLSVNTISRQQAAVRFGGIGSLSAFADQAGVHVGAARFNGAGNLSVNATVNQAAAARFNGVGNLSVDVQKVGAVHFASAAFTGSGNILSNVTSAQQTGTIFEGIGSLSGLGHGVGSFAVRLDGTGGLSIAPALQQQAAAYFFGEGNLSVRGIFGFAQICDLEFAMAASTGNLVITASMIDTLIGQTSITTDIGQSSVETEIAETSIETEIGCE